MLRRLPFAVALGALVALPALPAKADPVADFYRGKVVTIIVASNAGGSHSLYSQFLSNTIERMMPGNPTFIIQNEGGAGGTRAANYLYNRSPRDGTHIGIMLSDMPMAYRLKLTGVKYEPKEFHYLGGATKAQSVISVYKSAGVSTLAEARTKEIVLGSSGKGSQTYTIPAAVNAIMGTKFKIITGYPGMGAVDQALENKEIHGRAGVWASLRQNKGHLLDQMVHLGVADLEPIADLPGVPLITSMVADPKDRRVLEFIFGSGILGRAWVAPPGVPADRLKALRDTFWKALNDPETIKAARERNLEWDPVSWDMLQKAATAVVDTDDDIVNRARTIMGVDDGKS
ncbi:MAG: hypothetical protein FJX67_03420 [Alphaproteobacteria bacterium]|nr:hypothetical protein [Alphaproteobacteria bacterium]